LKTAVSCHKNTFPHLSAKPLNLLSQILVSWSVISWVRFWDTIGKWDLTKTV